MHHVTHRDGEATHTTIVVTKLSNVSFTNMLIPGFPIMAATSCSFPEKYASVNHNADESMDVNRYEINRGTVEYENRS